MQLMFATRWRHNINTLESLMNLFILFVYVSQCCYIYLDDWWSVIAHPCIPIQDNSIYFEWGNDDLALVVSGRDVERIRALLQDDLNRVSLWCKTNKLTVNTGKSQVLWSYSPRAPLNIDNAALYLDGQALDVVTTFCYLGVTIDRYLGFGIHLKKRIDLVRTRLKQLKRIRRASDKKTTLQVYMSMVRSIMEYCSFIVDGGPVWAARQYQTLQNDALRISELIRDPRGVDIDALHARNKIPKLRPARDRELLSHLHKLSRNPDNIVIPIREPREQQR